MNTQDFFINNQMSQAKQVKFLEKKRMTSYLLTGHATKQLQPMIKVPKSLMSSSQSLYLKMASPKPGKILELDSERTFDGIRLCEQYSGDGY